MARDYTLVRVTIWNDPDFQTRTTDAQWLYFTLLTHPLIDSCGVVPWREAKLVRTSTGMTLPRLRAAAANLAQVDLIAVDPDTEEALIRSFVRHDGVLKSPNMTKALVREHGAIASLTIKALVSREVRRAILEHPDWKGITVAGPVAKQFPDAETSAYTMVPDWFTTTPDPPTTSPRNPSRKGSDSVPSRFPEGFQIGSDSVPSELPPKQGNPSDLVPLSLTPNPQPLRDESLSAGAATAARRRKPEQPIPDTWQPNPKHHELAHTLGVDLDRESLRFRNHAQTNDRRCRDWDAAFRNWLDKATPASPTGRPGRPASPLADVPGWILR